MSYFTLDSNENIKEFIKATYDQAFDGYRLEWDELKKRVNRAEEAARLATLALDDIRLTLKALGNRQPPGTI